MSQFTVVGLFSARGKKYCETGLLPEWILHLCDQLWHQQQNTKRPSETHRVDVRRPSFCHHFCSVYNWNFHWVSRTFSLYLIYYNFTCPRGNFKWPSPNFVHQGNWVAIDLKQICGSIMSCMKRNNIYTIMANCLWAHWSVVLVFTSLTHEQSIPSNL